MGRGSSLDCVFDGFLIFSLMCSFDLVIFSFYSGLWIVCFICDCGLESQSRKTEDDKNRIESARSKLAGVGMNLTTHE